jgi:hypothetical protein
MILYDYESDKTNEALVDNGLGTRYLRVWDMIGYDRI